MRTPKPYTIGSYRISMVRDGTVSTEHEPVLRTPEDSARFLHAVIPSDLDREHFYVVLLNVRHRVLAVHLVSMGTVSSSAVHPREVFKPAIVAGASAVLLCHNHPSGDTEPSSEDTTLTKRLHAAGMLLGIEVLDHIILGDNGRFTSLLPGSGLP